MNRHFLNGGAALCDVYPEMFWVSFWSDQLWRASQYIAMQKVGDRASARSIGFRLPFSFLQRDWQTVREDKLKRAHEIMYAFDFSIKTGGSCSFELMFLDFFA